MNVYDGETDTGYQDTTESNGNAEFALADENYHFRADYNGTEFWSEAEKHCEVPTCMDTLIIVTNSTIVQVKDTDGTAKSGIQVYVFDGSTYKNFSGITDANGQIRFTLPQGDYRFRADLNGTQFWSGTEDHCEVPGCDTVEVVVTKPVTVSVKNTDGVALSGIRVYAFDGITYKNFSGITDANGRVSFTLPQGNYRFRADFNQTQFWSGEQNNCFLPGCQEAEVLVSIPVNVIVQDYLENPMMGAKVYAFKGSTYAGYSGTSDANGLVQFTLPFGSYRFRADYEGTQYWSGTDNSCSIPGCDWLTLRVGPVMTAVPTQTATPTPTFTPLATGTFTPTESLPVSPTVTLTVTLEPTATYTETTQPPTQTVTPTPTATITDTPGPDDPSGLGSSTNGNLYAISLHKKGLGSLIKSANQEEDSNQVSLSVINTDGAAQSGLTVYVYQGTTYSGFSAVTDETGQTAFILPDGDYRFRVDFGGTQFWSEAGSCGVPGCSAVELVVTLPVSVAVVDTDGTPLSGIHVYAFDGNTYSNHTAVTDENGQISFVLPQGDYRFRADLNGTQFWSGVENTCTLPGCTQDEVIVTKPLTVTVSSESGTPYPDLDVYVFSGTTYSGYHGKTDQTGQVQFTLPVGDYRFRADFNQVQFWSGTENTCTVPGCENDQVTLPGGSGQTQVTIDYEYDALNRLTDVTYSNGTGFHYVYDAVGNVLEYEMVINGQSTITTYS